MFTMTSSESLHAATLPLKLSSHPADGMNLSYQVWRNRTPSKHRYRVEFDGMPFTPTGEDEDFRFELRKQHDSLLVLAQWVRSLAPGIAIATESVAGTASIRYFLERIAQKLATLHEVERLADFDTSKTIAYDSGLKPISGEANMFEVVEETTA